MSVYRRTVASVPARGADETWQVIVGLLAGTCSSGARDELLSVTGIAASVIADMAPSDAAIVATCDGPRTRIYCVYDEDALDPDNADESSLPHDAMNGDWRVSLPCLAEDLAWVSAALAGKSRRITARDAAEKAPGEASDTAATASNAAAPGSMAIDLKGLFS